MERRGYIDDPGVGLSCGTSMTNNEADNSREPIAYQPNVKAVRSVEAVKSVKSVAVPTPDTSMSGKIASGADASRGSGLQPDVPPLTDTATPLP